MTYLLCTLDFSQFHELKPERSESGHEKFHKDFQRVLLGVKNESLIEVEQEHRLVKCAAENAILEFGNVEINPQQC